MGQKRSPAALVGLSAAAGAFAAAAMISAAVAPTARADAFSDILADITAEEGYANTAFANAATDFADHDEAAGLTQLYTGLDDDLIGVSDDLRVGLTDALTNTTVIPENEFEFSFPTPATEAGAITEAQTYYADGVALDSAITALPTGDYSGVALDNALASFDQWILPDQIEAIGLLAFVFPAF